MRHLWECVVGLSLLVIGCVQLPAENFPNPADKFKTFGHYFFSMKGAHFFLAHKHSLKIIFPLKILLYFMKWPFKSHDLTPGALCWHFL